MKKLMMVCILVISAASAAADVHYVGPSDDLQLMLDHPPEVGCGDTIIVTGDHVGMFDSALQGCLMDPIYLVLHGATIDGTLTFAAGGDVDVFGTWGNDIYNSDLPPSYDYGGPPPPNGITVDVTGIRLINLRVRDHHTGIVLATNADRSTLYGVDTYNNGSVFSRNGGWYGSGLHTSNGYGSTSNQQRLIENVHAFGPLGRLFYGNGSGYTFIRNITGIYWTGSNQDNLWSETYVDGWLQIRSVESESQVMRSVASTFLTYSASPPAFRQNVWGVIKAGAYDDAPSFDWDEDVFVNRSQSYGDTSRATVARWVNSPRPNLSTLEDFLLNGGPIPYHSGLQYGVQETFGIEMNGREDLEFFDEPQLFMWQNRYDETRARIVVYNKPSLATVSFDPTAFLRRGDAWELVNARNPAQTVSGTNWQGEEIAIPMGSWTTAAKLLSGAPFDESFPTFGVAILRNLSREPSYFWLPLEASRALQQ